MPRAHRQRGGAVLSLPGAVGTTAGARRSPRPVTPRTDPKRRLRGQADIWHATGSGRELETRAGVEGAGGGQGGRGKNSRELLGRRGETLSWRRGTT